VNNKPHHNSIFPEQARILSHLALDGEQFILRVQAPECARAARPGSFAHVQCDPALRLRRPISIMRTSAGEGWVELLYKAVGEGTRLLSRRNSGEMLDLLAPIGNPFQVHQEYPRPLLIGGGVGMPPMIFLSQTLVGNTAFRPFVILGSEVPFPFQPRPSKILAPTLPDGVIACMPLLDDWGIPSRLTSQSGFAGCHQGYVTDLARHWLENLTQQQRSEVEIFSCGPHPMLEAVSRLAEEFDLACQVSLEEFMACGVGGCAGCVVPVETSSGQQMQRVCVDGPVFDARQVFP